MEGLESCRMSAEEKGPGLATSVTTRLFDCIQHPLAGKRTKLRTDTAQD